VIGDWIDVDDAGSRRNFGSGATIGSLSEF
jgi:hypothetical protein